MVKRWKNTNSHHKKSGMSDKIDLKITAETKENEKRVHQEDKMDICTPIC